MGRPRARGGPRLALWVALWVALAHPGRAREPVEVTLRVSEPRPEIGRSVLVEIDLRAGDGVELEPPPAEGLAWEPLVVHDALLTGLPPGEAGRRWRYTVRLASLAPGRQALPVQVFRYQGPVGAGEVRTPALELEVGPPLEQVTGGLRGPKVPEVIPPPAWLGAAAFGLPALLWAVWVGVRRRRGGGEADPRAAALAGLAALEGEPRPASALAWVELAEWWRGYLRLRWPQAPEGCTSQELVDFLSTRGDLPAGALELIQGALARADRIKFSGDPLTDLEGSSAEETGGLPLGAARAFVEATWPPPPGEGR